MVDEFDDNTGTPTNPNPPGDGDDRQTSGSFWEVLTTAILDPDSGTVETSISVKIVYNSVTVAELFGEPDGDRSSYESGGTYTRGNQIGSGQAGLGTWTQYSVSFEESDGGNSGKFWRLRYPSTGTNDPYTLTIVWGGSTVFTNDYSSASAIESILEVTPTNSEYTYYRGEYTSGAGGQSGNVYYDVTIGPSTPPQPGDVDVPVVLQSDFGIEVLNDVGNQIWGSDNRVLSFVNAVRTGTITIPAGTPQSVEAYIDLTEFGWTLTNTSEIGVYVKTSMPVVRTDTGFTITWFNTYGITYTADFDLPFEYYLIRF